MACSANFGGCFSIALSGAEQVLMREVDAKARAEVLDKLAANL